MKKFKLVLRRGLLVLLILAPIAALAHFIIFPQETRSILIDFSDFKKDSQVYYAAGTSAQKIDSLKLMINIASARIAAFWERKQCNPRFIYCNTDADFKKYGNDLQSPAVTIYKLGPTIVISKDGLDLDIIAHEMSHAELFQRTGFFTVNYKIPKWFDEGLAMQNDYRDYYSEDTLSAKSVHFTHLPDIKSMTGANFYEGDHDKVMLNFLTAKHVVKNWYTKQKLDQLIKALNDGKSFETSFGQ